MKLYFYLNVPAAANAFTDTKSRSVVNVTPIRKPLSGIIVARRVTHTQTADAHSLIARTVKSPIQAAFAKQSAATTRKFLIVSAAEMCTKTISIARFVVMLTTRGTKPHTRASKETGPFKGAPERGAGL